MAVVGVGILLLMIAVATGLLIYNSNTNPRYIDDELYEEFEEWKSEKELDREGERAILSVVDSLTVVIYFMVSFYYGNWGVSWVIFLIGGAIKKIIRAYFDLEETKLHEK